jgi:hypothetical protein
MSVSTPLDFTYEWHLSPLVSESSSGLEEIIYTCNGSKLRALLHVRFLLQSPTLVTLLCRHEASNGNRGCCCSKKQSEKATSNWAPRSWYMNNYWYPWKRYHILIRTDVYGSWIFSYDIEIVNLCKKKCCSITTNSFCDARKWSYPVLKIQCISIFGHCSPESQTGLYSSDLYVWHVDSVTCHSVFY